MTFPSSTFNWQPSVQAREPMGDISRSKHSTVLSRKMEKGKIAWMYQDSETILEPTKWVKQCYRFQALAGFYKTSQCYSGRSCPWKLHLCPRSQFSVQWASICTFSHRLVPIHTVEQQDREINSQRRNWPCPFENLLTPSRLGTVLNNMATCYLCVKNVGVDCKHSLMRLAIDCWMFYYQTPGHSV